MTWYNRYGDFNISAPRLVLIDGASDVWVDVCYHGHNASASGIRYGEQQMLITGAGHHWDSYGILDLEAEPDFIRAAHEWELRHVGKWLAEWDETKGNKTRKGKRDEL